MPCPSLDTVPLPSNGLSDPVRDLSAHAFGAGEDLHGGAGQADIEALSDQRRGGRRAVGPLLVAATGTVAHLSPQRWFIQRRKKVRHQP